MHILFVHKNFPAQFGHIAGYLVNKKGFTCTFVSETNPGEVDGIRKIQYKTTGGATATTHYCSRTFENGIWHSDGVYEALKPLGESLQPDLIVGHSGFGSTLFLPELFPSTPILNYFEYYYRRNGDEIGFRPDYPASEASLLRLHARDAMILLDLQTCSAGYSPTRYQADLLPRVYRDKVRVIHDGVPTDVWRPHTDHELSLNGLSINSEQRVVTYVSRGFESMRGFDIFMKAAKRICDEDPNVIFLVAGTDRVCYGGDLNHIREKSFREHVLKQDDYDLSRIHFLGRVHPKVLAQILGRSDLHFYLTVPFVLSWSILDAMSCGATILASDTAPVREIIQHDENGLLCDFFDVDEFVRMALEVLRNPEPFKQRLGQAARKTIEERYCTRVIFPRITDFYLEVANGKA